MDALESRLNRCNAPVEEPVSPPEDALPAEPSREENLSSPLRTVDVPMGTHVLLDGQCVLTKIPREEDGRPVLMLRSGYPHHVGAGYFDDPPVERRLSENVIASPFLPRAAEGGEEEPAPVAEPESPVKQEGADEEHADVPSPSMPSPATSPDASPTGGAAKPAEPREPAIYKDKYYEGYSYATAQQQIAKERREKEVLMDEKAKKFKQKGKSKPYKAKKQLVQIICPSNDGSDTLHPYMFKEVMAKVAP